MLDLPPELLVLIARGVPVEDLQNFALTNRQCAGAVQNLLTNPTYPGVRERLEARYKRLDEEFSLQYAYLKGHTGSYDDPLFDDDGWPAVATGSRIKNRIEILLGALTASPSQTIMNQINQLLRKFERLVTQGPRAPKKRWCATM